jgi:hypothetical protein
MDVVLMAAGVQEWVNTGRAEAKAEAEAAAAAAVRSPASKKKA